MNAYDNAYTIVSSFSTDGKSGSRYSFIMLLFSSY